METSHCESCPTQVSWKVMFKCQSCFSCFFPVRPIRPVLKQKIVPDNFQCFFWRGYLRNPYALRNPNILAQGPQGLQTVILNFEIFTQRPQITPDHTRSYQKHGCIFLIWALPNSFLRYPLPNSGSNPNRGTRIPILVLGYGC